MTDAAVQAVARAIRSAGKASGISEDDALQFAHAAVSAYEDCLRNSELVIVPVQAMDAMVRHDRDIAESLKQNEADHAAVKPRLARFWELTLTDKR